jgi:hypothetical protein
MLHWRIWRENIRSSLLTGKGIEKYPSLTFVRMRETMIAARSKPSGIRIKKQLPLYANRKGSSI